MQKNKKLILLTYDFPFGRSEKTFLSYELLKLSENFDSIEIINQKKIYEESILNQNLKNIKINTEFSGRLTLTNYFIIFIKYVIFDRIFWSEIGSILFKRKFFKKLKMCVSEIILSFILFNYFMERKSNLDGLIFYSFWSNHSLISFFRLKNKLTNSKFVARALGSDLNGYLENDDYVPFKKIKFLELDKLILLGDYQKKKLENIPLNKKSIEISPLGIKLQKEIKTNNLNEDIVFLSCGNLIKIKNNFLMIDFLKRFSLKIGKKVNFILIGDGILKNKIELELLKSKNQINFKYYSYVENFVDFVKQSKTNFFLNFSSQEGMPFTVMETMSLGIPTIASNIDPNNFLVRENGYLFDLKNYNSSIEKIINEIQSDIHNKKLYFEKCKNSYNFINKNLDNTKCFNNFIKILMNFYL